MSLTIWLLRKSVSGFFFFDWATEWALIWQGLMGPARVGLGCRSWPAGRVRVQVRVWKNLARTQPVAIPISSFDSVLNFSQGLENASFNALKPLEMDSGELSFNAFVKDIHEIGMRLVAEKVRETEIRKLESNFV